MYERLLEQVGERRRHYGKNLPPPGTAEQLQQLRERAGAELACDLPDAYLLFLGRANGLEWNGLTIYATETSPIVGTPDRTIPGMVEANLALRDREELAACLVFGCSELSLYVRVIATGEYQVLDEYALDVMAVPQSFEQMIAEALEEHL